MPTQTDVQISPQAHDDLRAFAEAQGVSIEALVAAIIDEEAVRLMAITTR